MRAILIALSILILLISSDVCGADIYALISSGRLDEAREARFNLSTAAQRDGNNLFFQSLLEPDAGRSAQLKQAALKASVAGLYQEQIYYGLAQYYLAIDDYPKLNEIIGQYLSKFEKGRHRAEALRLSMLTDEKAGQYESAIRQADRFALRYSDGDAEQWGHIDKARQMFAHKKSIGARNLLKRASKAKSGVGVPQALYMLAVDAIKRKRIDDAVFYYNILREGYPHAIGLDALIDKMSHLPSTGTRESGADRRTGTFYSVQVGVFSDNGNAKRQAKIFEKYDHKVEIKSKEVVYVGRFDSYDAAFAFKRTLESAHAEIYQVVAR
jgi:tetratricopeptide (TPR) repeat protein